MEAATEFKQKFSHLFENSLLEELESRSILMNMSAGAQLIEAGKLIMGVPLVIKGTAKVCRANDEGQELLLYYVQVGATCPMSLTCFMTSQLSSINAYAEEELTFLVVPAQIANELFQTNTSWKKFIMTTILDGLTEVVKSIDDVAFKKMDERLVTYLKQKTKISGSSLVNLSHQQIADELGTNRVVVSRLLKKLETDKKLLLYRNQIKLFRDL
jgi:CRP/FNR family transcriptional regulator